MTIQDKITEILKESRWSQEEFARRLGVSFKAVNNWANGKSKPRDDNLKTIDQFYFDIVGRTEISPKLLEETEQKALSTHIELDELLENEDLLNTATLYLTYHTNTIEGSTMTIDEVRTVLSDDNAIIKDRTVREQMEARNHRTAFLYLLSELKRQGKDFKWSSDLIREIHLRLMNGIIESAGYYRNHGVRVMGSHAARANYLSVPDKMEELIEYMNKPDKNLIGYLAVTHANFEKIHPFGDGNGRTGRLIMFAQALQNEVVPPLVIKERKRAYYKYLEIAHTQEDYTFLRLFIAESILFTDRLLK